MKIVELYKSLADETRVRIINLLYNSELCVCKLMENLNMPQSSLGHHLAMLKKAGFIKSRKNGKWTYYSINKNIDKTRMILMETLISNIINEQICIRDKVKMLDNNKAC